MSLQRDRYFLDSNVFFYARVGDRNYGKCCRSIVEKVYRREIEAYIDTIVLLEVANAIFKYFKSIQVARDELTALMSLPMKIIDVKPEDVIQALSPELSPYDAIHIYISHILNAKIISADRDFDMYGRVDPCAVR